MNNESKIIDKFILFSLKKKGNRNRPNILNFCKYEPAIISGPKGPVIFLGWFDVKPKMSFFKAQFVSGEKIN